MRFPRATSKREGVARVWRVTEEKKKNNNNKNHLNSALYALGALENKRKVRVANRFVQFKVCFRTVNMKKLKCKHCPVLADGVSKTPLDI